MQGLENEIWTAFQKEDIRGLSSLFQKLPTLETPIKGLSPLTMAVMLYDQEFVSQLLQAGAEPNFKNDDKSTALTASRDLEMTKLLLKHGASARFEVESEIGTSLHVACEYRDLASAETLLDSGEGYYCAGVFDEFYRTPLAVAAGLGDSRMVALLLHNRFPVDLTDVRTAACTPLHLAVEERHEDVVKLLVASGADIHLNHGLGRTPWEMAEEDFELRELLIPPTNITDPKGVEAPLRIPPDQKET